MSAMTPERSVSQRMEALKQANEVRTGRSRLKRDLKAGRVNTAALILDPPAIAEGMKVLDVLLAAPKVGPVKAHRLMRVCRVAASKTVGGLTERQRGEIVMFLP